MWKVVALLRLATQSAGLDVVRMPPLSSTASAHVTGATGLGSNPLSPGLGHNPPLRRIRLLIGRAAEFQYAIFSHRGALLHEDPVGGGGALLVTLRRSHTTGMKSKVHPTYKTKYRVANWPAYNQALVRRGEALLHEYPLRVGRRGPPFSGPSAGATLRE